MGFVKGDIGDELMVQLSKDIATSKSARVIVPVCHIYLEHMVFARVQVFFVVFHSFV